MRQKLKDSKPSDVLANYPPAECEAVIPGSETCWGSYGDRRPLGSDHFREQCTCPSRSIQPTGRARLEPATVQEKDTLLNMVDKHLNAHPFIPDINGTNPSSEEIYRQAVSELYHFCHTHNWYKTWAYMWVNWYKPLEPLGAPNK